MKKIFLYSILIFISSCNFAQNNDTENLQIEKDSLVEDIDSVNINYELNVIDSAKCGLNFKKGRNYQETKSKMIQIRNKLGKEYFKLQDSPEKNNFLDSVSYVFSDLLLNEILPYWYGTDYDFSGYTAVPNQGYVGCSYLVSTSLEGMGLNVNRYKLAQQNPRNEALSVAIVEKNMLVFNEIIESDDIKQMLEKIDEGLYFVGLVNHVGYLYKFDKVCYFIHANYIEGYVNIELAETSDAFFSSVYYLSKISMNREFAQKWITNDEFKIFR